MPDGGLRGGGRGTGGAMARTGCCTRAMRTACGSRRSGMMKWTVRTGRARPGAGSRFQNRANRRILPVLLRPPRNGASPGSSRSPRDERDCRMKRTGMPWGAAWRGLRALPGRPRPGLRISRWLGAGRQRGGPAPHLYGEYVVGKGAGEEASVRHQRADRAGRGPDVLTISKPRGWRASTPRISTRAARAGTGRWWRRWKWRRTTKCA